MKWIRNYFVKDKTVFCDLRNQMKRMNLTCIILSADLKNIVVGGRIVIPFHLVLV